jgi:hypothetical protein
VASSCNLHITKTFVGFHLIKVTYTGMCYLFVLGFSYPAAAYKKITAKNVEWAFSPKCQKITVVMKRYTDAKNALKCSLHTYKEIAKNQVINEKRFAIVLKMLDCLFRYDFGPYPV